MYRPNASVLDNYNYSFVYMKTSYIVMSQITWFVDSYKNSLNFQEVSHLIVVIWSVGRVGRIRRSVFPFNNIIISIIIQVDVLLFDYN